ncbi:MAG: dienelactone hydrolase family protein [Spirochaetaceae bacterium]|nr:dienelactone hydrolase family protein [Spirochaetaceae bacterium]
MFLRWLFLAILTLVLTACVSFNKSSYVGSNILISDQGISYMYMFCEDSGLNYVITFPKDYDPTKQYPLIVYLHSMAERGTDLEKLIQNEVGQGNGLSKYALDGKLTQFFTISPLCPEGTYWSFLTKRLNILLNNITNDKNIDIDRIFLTGVSMGGMGTWSFAMDYPHWFAGIAPISGGIYKPFMSDNIEDIQNIPIWIFHDKYDREIPIEKTSNILRKLKEVNADLQITIYEEGEHYINEKVFEEGELFDWFFTL